MKYYFYLPKIFARTLTQANFFTSPSRMPRPLAAWMNGQKICNGGAVSLAKINTLVLPA